MSDLNDLFKQLAEAKAQDPKYQQAKKLEEQVKKSVKTDLGGLFSQLAEVKAEDPKVQKARKIEKQVQEGVKADLGSLFAELASLKKQQDQMVEAHPELAEEVVEPTPEPEVPAEPVVEEVIEEAAPVMTPVGVVPPEAQVPNLDKYLKSNKPKEEVDPLTNEFKQIGDKIKYLEQWISKIQNTGPGSGEVNFRYLDDVDRSTIIDGNFLTYNADTRKFEFREVVTSGGGVAQVQSDWTEVNTTAKSFIKNKPTLFSGSYTDLTNKPTIPTVPTNVSSFTNDANYVTTTGLNTTLGSFVNNASFQMTLGDYATKAYVTAQGYLTTVSWNDVTSKPTLFSGSYTDLTNKPTIPSLTGYATETFVNTAIANVIGAAPAALDTLKEIADQLAADESIVSSLTTTVADKVSLTGSYANPTWITSLAYSKLTGAPANVSAFTNDVGYISTIHVADLPAGIPVSKLSSSTVVINGTTIQLGSSASITAPAGTLTGGTLNSTVTSSSLTSVGTLTSLSTSGSVTSNAAVAFIAGTAAESGVALQMPREGALRDMTNGASTMYFDASNGGSTHGYFNFRSSNAFTSLLHLGIAKAEFNAGMEIKGQTPYVGRTPFNSALDTVVTVDNIKYRISNQGGVFPQIASAVGSQVDVCYDVLGVVNGVGTANAENSGYLLAANGTWLSIFSAHGMDARGDRLTAHITDKAAGKIYRATFMKTNNSSNADGYNIIVERIL